MKILKAFLVAFVVVGVLTGSLKSQGNEGISPERMEEMAKKALERSIEARKELYHEFLPTPEDLGPGWLLPWQIPPSLRNYASDDAYWQSISGGLGGDAFEFTGIISLVVEFSPQQLEKFLDMMVSMARDIPSEDVPSGLTPEQFSLALILFLLRWQLSPSLAKKMELVCSWLEETQKVMGELLAEKQLGGGDKTKIVEKKGEQYLISEIIMKSVKAMRAQEIRQAVVDEATSVEELTGMMYTTCDDWEALGSGEVDPGEFHLRHVVVTLTILDRDRMADIIDDLEPEEAGHLENKLNQRLSEFRDFSVEVWKKKTIAELEKQLGQATNPDRRRDIQNELAKVPEAAGKFKNAMPKIEIEVYTRDFGDNCYVINMKGEFKLPEFTFPATNLQACLRNGSAVVFIGLGGNFTPEQLKGELDLFLSEMDARTAFFRE